MPLILTLTRVLVGWHFLYEGFVKLAMPDWTSYHYLMESKWLFSGFFHWITANPTALAVTDFLNIWGLILIGSGLILGVFVRVASISGAIKPEDGFRYAFENGADFTCVGMFDFQVIDHANIVSDTINSGLKREREWYG